MIIGIDFDDVLADTIGQLILFHNETYGTELTRKQFHSPRWWEVWGGTRDQSVNKFFEFKKSPYFKDVKPLEYAIDAIDELSNNHTLVVITSRQVEFVKETNEWINEHFPNKFKDIFLTNHAHWALSGTSTTKLAICKQENVDILIEDNLDYAEECAEENIQVLLLDTPWNQGTLPDNVYRVHSWKEILQHKILLDI